MESLSLENKFSCLKKNSLTKNIITILAGSFLLAISAQIAIPIKPVPFTLQTLAVLFIGIFFGSKMGSKIVIAYLIEGSLGLPVFAHFTSGIPILLGPDGGYLLGFIPAVIVTGYLLQHSWARKNRLTIFVCLLVGDITLFILGYFTLAKFIGLGWYNAYLVGVAPFYLGEAMKLSILVAIAPFLRQRTTLNS